MTNYTLLTGATGLVGRYLLRDLLLNGHRLAVVVRPTRRLAAEQRIESILQMWEAELGKELARPIVLTGDITQSGFGLNAEQRGWIRRHCDRLIHSAAILEFFGSDRSGEPWRTNLNGTRNMLDLCRDTNIFDLHYISTAYVAGLRGDRAMEDELNVGQEFRNDYENSKFQAETEVRAADFLDRLTVYRPAVITGDSVTGYTNTYHGIYLYLRLLSMMVPLVPRNRHGVRNTPVRLPITGKERRNLIPIDWVSAVTCRLFETEAAHGGTYHMAPDTPITSGEVIQYCCDYFNSTGVEYVGDEDVDTRRQPSFFQRMLPDMSTYEAYMRTDNTFDMTNLKRFTSDLPCPAMDRTVIHRYLKFGEQDRWGKRRQPRPEVVFDFGKHLQSLGLAAFDESPNADAFNTVGIDIAGPGGGQWAMLLNGERALSVHRGLPTVQSPVLRMTAQGFQQLLRDPHGDRLDQILQCWEIPRGYAAEQSQLCDRVLPELVPGILAATSD